MKDHAEVCPLSREGCSSLYPPDYRAAFAFSALLYPQSHQCTLRLPTRFGRTMGLPCSAYVTEWVRSALSAGGVGCPRGRRSDTSFPPQCLLAQATQHLRLVPLNDVYQAFACANHTTHPSPLSALMLADTSVASRFHWQPYG